MTDEAWDGQGTDPWLVDQLENEATLAKHEHDFRELYLPLLLTWLSLATKRVTHNGIIDPAAVYSIDWTSSLRKLRASVLATIGEAYLPLLGPSYNYTQRAAITAHLDLALQRMAKMPTYIKTLIGRELLRGANSGLTATQIAENVSVLLANSTKWSNFATTTTRTEIGSALQVGRYDAFNVVSETLGRKLMKQWITCMDDRVRPTHRAVSRHVVPVGETFQVGRSSMRYPGDPMAPPQETRLCRCSMLLLDPATGENITRRQI